MLEPGFKGFTEELIIDSVSSAAIYLAIYESSVSKGLIKDLKDVLALIFLTTIMALMVAILIRSLRVKVIFKTSVPALTYASLMLIIGLVIWVPRTLIRPDQVSIEGSLVLALLLVSVLLSISLKRAKGEWKVEAERYRAYRLGIMGLPRRIKLIMSYSNEFIESVIKETGKHN